LTKNKLSDFPDFPDFRTKTMHPKHEIIRCERCEATFECKANSFTKCQCSTVQLTINEVQYVSELYDGCLCANCLLVIQQEYRVEMGLD
jgi:hypothetical protein